MMKLQIFSLFFLLFVFASTTYAQNIQITQIDFATSIEDREPVGIDTAFTADVGTIYCFTRIQGISDTTQITHEWYYKQEEKALVNLTVASDDWRTWSSKKILQSWTGPWRVIVLGPEGNVLATKNFAVK
ncbi:DUF2914 domain-containing protein [Fodinibius sp. SL11]|uniref:DUF2914 domain-containing protein n=1 Tax=Fodinibius sp. SL11 TaxID=3425690 RepID=UPI003F881E70